MQIRMLETRRGVYNGQQHDIRLFIKGEVYTEGVNISPDLVAIYLRSGEAVAVPSAENRETKVLTPPETKEITFAPEPTDHVETQPETKEMKKRGRKPKK